MSPIGFWWTGEHVVMATVPKSAKVRALRQNPRVALTIDTQGQWPPRVLLIRGAARVELVDGVPDAYVEAARKGGVPAEHFEGWEQGVRALYDQMVLITIEPDKRSGQPCIRGLRITVQDVLDYLASDMSVDDILSDFPDLTAEDIRACLAFADRE